MQGAPNAGPLSGKSRFLSNLFGGRKGRRSVEEIRSSERESEDSFSSGRGSEREEVALGAAEVMRRKLLRQAGVKSSRKAAGWEDREQ